MTAKRISGWWYGLIAVPLAIGAALGTWVMLGMLDEIGEMPRLVVPGERDVALDAKEYIVYGETQSVVDGVGYAHVAFSVTCTLDDADGAPVALEARSSSTKYTFGSYAGSSMFEVDVPKAGTYHLSCDGGPGVVAIGGGLGARIGLVVAAILGGMAVAVVVFFLVRRRRKQHPPR